MTLPSRRGIRRVLGIIAVVLAAGLSHAGDVTTAKLSNGMPLLVSRDPSSPLVVMQLWVGHGSIDETDREAGLAHFLEHLAFRGRDVAARVEQAGGDINAYTSNDHTVYHLTVPADRWRDGVASLHDVFRGLAFDKDAFEQERNVVIEEMRRADDMPQRVVYRAFFETAAKGHPLGRPVIGYDETIRKAQPEDVQSFYKRFYNPDASFLVVVGDIDTAAAVKALDGTIGDVRRPAWQAPLTGSPHPVAGPAVTVSPMDVTSCHVMVGFPIPGISDERQPALDVLSYLLGESPGSLLVRKLRDEQQLVTSVSSHTMTFRQAGWFVVRANVAPGKLLPFADALQKLLFAPLPDDESKNLPRVIRSYEAHRLFGRERFHDRASDMGGSFFYFSDPDYSDRYLDRIRAVAFPDVTAVQRAFLRPPSMTVAVVLPKDKTDLEPELRRRFGAMTQPSKTGTDQPARKEAVKIAVPAETGLKKLKLKNGISLLVNRRPESGTFAVSIASLAGSRIETPQTCGLSQFTLSALLRGTTTRGYRDIRDRIEATGGSLDGFSTSNISGIRGRFLTDSFDDALDILGDILLNFKPSPEELQKLRTIATADIKKKQENPNRLLRDLFYTRAFRQSPLACPPDGTEGTVATFNQEPVTSQFRRIFSARNLYVSLSGALPAGAEERLSAMLEKLPSPKFDTVTIDPEPEPGVATKSASFKQTHIMVGFPTAGLNDPLRPSFHLLATILSNQSGRLFTTLRDKEGLAYSLGAFNIEAPETSFFTLYIATAPANRDKVRDGLLRELERLVRDGVTDDELAKAKRQIATDMAQARQENLDIASTHAQNALLFGAPLYHKTFEEKVNAVTRQQLVEQVREFLHPDRAVTAVIEGAAP